MFYERFIEQCKIKGLSPAAVTRELGLNNSSSTSWKRGAIPKGETLQKLADFFHVSIDYLLGNVDNPFFYLDNQRIIREINSYSDDDILPQNRIMAALAMLSENGQRIAADRVEELTEIPRYRRPDRPAASSPAPGDTDTPTERDGAEGPPEGE